MLNHISVLWPSRWALGQSSYIDVCYSDSREEQIWKCWTCSLTREACKHRGCGWFKCCQLCVACWLGWLCLCVPYCVSSNKRALITCQSNQHRWHHVHVVKGWHLQASCCWLVALLMVRRMPVQLWCEMCFFVNTVWTCVLFAWWGSGRCLCNYSAEGISACVGVLLCAEIAIAGLAKLKVRPESFAKDSNVVSLVSPADLNQLLSDACFTCCGEHALWCGPWRILHQTFEPWCLYKPCLEMTP